MLTVERQAVITPAIVDCAMEYVEYRQLVETCAEMGTTTGSEPTEERIGFTKLNRQRMRRVEQTCVLADETLRALSEIDKPIIWLTLVEAWCGDAAQIVPVFHKISEAQPLVRLRFILRDAHLSVMDAFLTNGGRSIPKVIMLDSETLDVLGDWGPRPEEAQSLFAELKATGLSHDEIMTHLHKWYAQNKTIETQRSLVRFLRTRAESSVKS